MKNYFNQLCDQIFSHAQQGEDVLLSLSGEDQNYIRWNQSKIRQATHVQQYSVEISLYKEQKKITITTDLSLDLSDDKNLILSLLDRARNEMTALLPDPFFTALEPQAPTVKEFKNSLPSSTEVMDTVAELTKHLDFAGFYAGGPQVRALRSSSGLNHWFSTESFFLDYSLYTVNAAHENKAFKGLYSEDLWQPSALQKQLLEGEKQISLLKTKSMKLAPGEYRVYLSPASVAEILGTINFGGLSYSSYRNGNSPFQKLASGERQLSPKFSLSEDLQLGRAPVFNAAGEVAPNFLPLIENGELKNWLITSRSGKEYGVPHNGASISWGGEQIKSPRIHPGHLPETEILQRLDTGLYLGNLHYLNWSDLQNARITGMTRYACFWVEKGEIRAPIQDLRFDESVYRLFGSELEDLTNFTEIEPSVDTYYRRSVGAKQIPGALIKNFRFTL